MACVSKMDNYSSKNGIYSLKLSIFVACVV